MSRVFIVKAKKKEYNKATLPQELFETVKRPFMNNEEVYFHDHGDGVLHAHHHTQTKTVLNRLARAIGHLEYVKRMVEEGKDCTEVLIQLAAIRSALNNTAKIILKDHIEHCISDADGGNEDRLKELNDAIDKFI